MKIKNPTLFASTLVENYLNQGMVSMSKRDLDLLFLHALCLDKQYSFPEDFHRACRELKLGEFKLRSMLKDMHLRYQVFDQDTAVDRFVSIIKKQEFDVTRSHLSFVVRDPILRIYIEEWIAKASCFSDTSFNPEVVKITRRGFEKLINCARQKKNFENDIPEELKEKFRDSGGQTLGRIFLEALSDSVGEAAGKISIKTIAAGIEVALKSLVS